MDAQDEIWKRIYHSMEKPPQTNGAEETDRGFFEMFGRMTTEAEQMDQEEEVDDIPPEQESDIQPEETDQMLKEFLGLNMEELYSEVVYEMLHMVGSEAESCDREQILSYLNEAFKLEPEKHQEILQAVKDKEAPNIILNVEIIQAKDLKPKDPNGLSDPFCTLYLSSAPNHKYHTCVKPETLTPLWQEHFYLPVDNTSSDSLCLEVWDFDPAETIKEKVTKISGVKGVKGLSKLMKEIAVTASTGKHDNEMIGVAQIKLKSIPSYGQTRWVDLEKRPKSSSVQGNLKLRMNFGSQKNHHVACQEYRHILRLLLLHEIEKNKKDGEDWSGKLSDLAHIVLGQHSSQSGLSPHHEILAQWIEFAKLHSNHQLSFTLFASLIDVIIPGLKETKYSQDEVKMFWESNKKLLPSLFTHIKHLVKMNPKDRRHLEQTTSVLKILNNLCILKSNSDIDLFPNELYGWLDQNKDSEKSIRSVINEAIVQTSTEWFAQALDSNQHSDASDENALKQAIKVTQAVRNDLQKSVEYYDKLFSTFLDLGHSKLVYTVYEDKVCDLVKPLVNKVCSSMKPIHFKQSMYEKSNEENDAVSLGTSLFELYLLVQRFALLGSGIFSEEGKELKISQFHTWFYHGVAKWLDIAVYKAIARIDKAIELDKLTPVDTTVKYSSSALDTLSIFYQIKVFWTQLSWPDIEGSYTFVAKILDDLCRCCVYYADNMTSKLINSSNNSSPSEENSHLFSVTNEWCLAVNNIDYVKQSLQPFAKDLGVESVIKKLSEFKNQSTAETCDHTIKLVIENTVDIIANKIIELLESISDKMANPIRDMLDEMCVNCVDHETSIDSLMQYLDKNLMTLHSQLNTINFQKMLSIIWQRVVIILNELLNTALELKKSHCYFKTLESAVDILKSFFQEGDSTLNTEEIDGMKRTLSIHGLNTPDLIHQYYLERVEFQNSISTSNDGMLTVKVAFIGDHLKIDIMNARNIPPHDSNGFCDPFVKINFLPKEKFSHLSHLKTKTQKKTLFPLFEETFHVELKTEERLTNALIHFIVKDQDFIYFNQFVGEAFLPFSEINTLGSSNEETDQTHLILHKPTADSKIMKVLDLRQGEKQAKDFIKKQRAKMGEKC